VGQSTPPKPPAARRRPNRGGVEGARGEAARREGPAVAGEAAGVVDVDAGMVEDDLDVTYGGRVACGRSRCAHAARRLAVEHMPAEHPPRARREAEAILERDHRGEVDVPRRRLSSSGASVHRLRAVDASAPVEGRDE
jgi:hypothetical protein